MNFVLILKTVNVLKIFKDYLGINKTTLNI